MNAHDVAVMQVLIFFLLIYGTFLLAWTAWRRFLRDGDVVAEANQILRDQASLESYVEDWMPLSVKVRVAEARAVEKEREAHP